MATGTDAGGNWTTDATARTVTATPAVGDLIVVVHGVSGWASGEVATITDNNSDGLGTYTRLGDATTPLSNGGGTACALWISVRNSLVGSATSTVFTNGLTGSVTGNGLTVLRFSGMTRTGASAILQSIGESSATENPPTITFGATTKTTNPVVLACMGEDNPLAITPPTGFTEADDTGWATPTTGIEVCWDDAGNTATLFSWTGGATTDHNEVGLELDTSVPIATGRSDETDTAYARGMAVGLGLATETDTAYALALAPNLEVGRANETDTASALTLLQLAATGRADETDTASALTLLQLAAAGMATETDSAFALTGTQLVPLGRSDETDTAFALAAVVVVATGRADEIDTSFALAAISIAAAGLSLEIDTSFALGALELVATGRADETDTAFALALAGGPMLPGVAEETDTAYALGVGIGVGLAIEVDTAYVLYPYVDNGIRYDLVTGRMVKILTNKVCISL